MVQDFLTALRKTIPTKQILIDLLSRHAYAHDASPYLLIPQAVVIVESEAEVITTLQLATQYHIPVTFRAAGTSLSGQAQSDSVLLVLGQNWRDHTILEEGQKIRLQPGMIGAEANLFLQPYGRKLGPDPASINSAKIGGIAANNASGMCCGIVHNTYHTLAGIRLIFTEGSILDTEDAESRKSFASKQSPVLAELQQMRTEILQDPDLSTFIQNQYRLKNTLGYSLNAFVDFEDPIDILAHLMIGSEGTLAFIASITYHTIPHCAYEAAALLLFDDLITACRASLVLPQAEIAAIELMDEAALSAVKFKVKKGQAALLIDVKAETPAALQAKIDLIAADFIINRKEYNTLWAIRRGILPAVAGARRPGSAMINEDVAVSPQDLPEFCQDLTALFAEHGYHKSCIFGHAKDGNLHFLLEADFDNQEGIAQYDGFMQALVCLITESYQGTLKAEHGTGRNMAPFVAQAWGEKAYRLMQKIKALFDPAGILNPEVILSQNPELHITNLKPLPRVDPLIDRCIECGFCETVCPSNKLTLTPRQRIVALRDMQRLGQEFEGFQYRGLDTCAATGLCKGACPVGINTGDMVRKKRFQAKAAWQHFLMRLWLKHFALVMRVMRLVIPAQAGIPHTGSYLLDSRLRGNDKQPIYYFPSCSARLFHTDQQEVLENILARLGFQLITLKGSANECCGLMFKSKGYLREALTAANHLEHFLDLVKGPILCEMGSCVLQMRHSFIKTLAVFDILDFLADRLQDYPLKQHDKTVMLHITCSMQRLELQDKMLSLAKRCAKNVIVPPDIHCCGFAGEKGFTHPELNASALSTLKSQIPVECHEGYSMSLACEMGLSKAAGIPYQSLLYLIFESL